MHPKLVIEKLITLFAFGSVILSTNLMVSAAVIADESLCYELESELEGKWVGEASESVSVEKDSQNAMLTCNWDLALSFYVSFDRVEGNECIFEVGGFLNVEHQDLDAASSNSDVKATRYCSWSDSVSLNDHSLSVSFLPKNRANAEFKLEFDFKYTRGTEFDKTMYVLKHTEYELATLTPENRIVLEAGFLEKKSE